MKTFEDIVDEHPLCLIGRERFIKKNYPAFFEAVVCFSEMHTVLCDLSFKQKLWHYINNEPTIPICQECNVKSPQFVSISEGYKTFCSAKCSANSSITKNKREQSCKGLYGVSNVSQSEQIKTRKTETTFENYGVRYPAQSTIVRGKMRDTTEKNHGKINYFQTDEFKRSMKQRARKKYRVESFNQSEEIKNKKIQTWTSKYGVANPGLLRDSLTTSKPEKLLRSQLGGEKFRLEGKEFDIRIDNVLIEVDGDFYHPQKLESLSFIQLNNLTNDKRKQDIAVSKGFVLYRILVSSLPQKITFDNIRKNSYKPDYSLTSDQCIMQSQYIHKFFKNCKPKRQQKYKRLLVGFLRTFVSKDADWLREVADVIEKLVSANCEYPQYDLTIENLKTLYEKNTRT